MLKASAVQVEITTTFNSLLPTTYELQACNRTLIEDDAFDNNKITSIKWTLFSSAGKCATQPVLLFGVYDLVL